MKFISVAPPQLYRSFVTVLTLIYMLLSACFKKLIFVFRIQVPAQDPEVLHQIL